MKLDEVQMKKVSVLFVCLGNICRSPTAHGVFQHLVNESGLAEKITVDSAGTAAYHLGNPPDSRSQKAAKRRGIDLSYQRARQVNAQDIHDFDYVLAMDQSNFNNLLQICPAGLENKIRMFMEFSESASSIEVPDPYYGGEMGFENVLDMVEYASRGLLRHIQSRHF